MAGTVIYEAHPTMFRAHPFWFIGCIILIPVFGLGVLLLLYWYIHTRRLPSPTVSCSTRGAS